MAKFIYVYHGGKAPEGEEEYARVMEAWGNWFASAGESLIDGGNPVGMSTTVFPGGRIENNGGANPISGYSLVEMADTDAAVTFARGCPIIDDGGSVELAECFDM
jgi:hypothetical protein